MEVIQPGNSHSGEEKFGDEALFSYLVDKKGLDVIVGVLGLRQKVRAEHLKGSVVDSGDTQFTVRPDGIEFVMEGEGGEPWRGEIGYDDARHIVANYIAERLHEEPSQGD